MLIISDDLLIDRGHRRLVFVHPENPFRCLKILDPNNLPTDIRARKSWVTRFRPVSSFDNNHLEVREYERLVTNGSAGASCFPKLHGIVATNRGDALVQDLVRNRDGTISPNLQTFLRRVGSDDEILFRLRSAMADFAALLLSSRAIVHDLHPLNIVVQENGGAFRLMIVDGLGTHSVVPALYRVPGLVTQRMKKRISGLFQGLPAALVPGGIGVNGSQFALWNGRERLGIMATATHFMVENLPALENATFVATFGV